MFSKSNKKKNKNLGVQKRHLLSLPHFPIGLQSGFIECTPYSFLTILFLSKDIDTTVTIDIQTNIAINGNPSIDANF